MKRKILAILILATVLLSGCMMPTNSSNSGNNNGGTTLGDIIGGVLGGGGTTIGGLTDLIIGKIKLTQADLVGNWKYSSPGCAFTSENLLAEAGGAAIAAQIKSQLGSYYSNLGVNANNTYFTFTQDGTFTAQILGIPWSGSYTFNPSNGSINLKGLLLSSTAYVTRTSTGISLTFESKKLLSLFQTLAKLSGNSTVSTIGDLSTNYKGLRIGFDMKK